MDERINGLLNVYMKLFNGFSKYASPRFINIGILFKNIIRSLKSKKISFKLKNKELTVKQKTNISFKNLNKELNRFLEALFKNLSRIVGDAAAKGLIREGMKKSYNDNIKFIRRNGVNFPNWFTEQLKKSKMIKAVESFFE